MTWSPPPPPGQRRGEGLRSALTIVGVVVAVVGGTLWWVSRPPTYESSLDWQRGSASISGTATNRSDAGCSHFTLHIRFYDHNDALVGEEQDPDIGEVAAGQSREWSYDLTSLGVVPYDVPASVTSATTTASCEDQH